MTDLARHTIGYEHLTSADNTGNYPPHNIERITEAHYRLTLAVAGFSRDNITITVKDGLLNIIGVFDIAPVQTNVRFPEPRTSPHVLYQGIAFRNFNRQFKIGPDVEIIDAHMVNGLLIVDMERLIPEQKILKKIPVR